MAETEVPEIELIIKASTIDGRRKGACIFCQVIRWFSLRFNRQTVRLVNVSTSASLCTENTVVGSFLASKIANCCVRFLGIFHGFVSVGWTEDNLSQDHDCRHEETPSWLQEQLWSKKRNIFKINISLSLPSQAAQPPILIDNGVAVLENDLIERHIMKKIPGGHNLFVPDQVLTFPHVGISLISWLYIHRRSIRRLRMSTVSSSWCSSRETKWARRPWPTLWSSKNILEIKL